MSQPKPESDPKPKKTTEPIWFRLCTHQFTCNYAGQKPGVAKCKQLIREAKMVVLSEGSQTIKSLFSIEDWSHLELMTLAIDFQNENDDTYDFEIEACMENKRHRKVYKPRKKLYKPTDLTENLQIFHFFQNSSNRIQMFIYIIQDELAVYTKTLLLCKGFRAFGSYKCTNCPAKWNSPHSFLEYRQNCASCDVMVSPFRRELHYDVPQPEIQRYGCINPSCLFHRHAKSDSPRSFLKYSGGAPNRRAGNTEWRTC